MRRGRAPPFRPSRKLSSLATATQPSKARRRRPLPSDTPSTERRHRLRLSWRHRKLHFRRRAVSDGAGQAYPSACRRPALPVRTATWGLTPQTSLTAFVPSQTAAESWPPPATRSPWRNHSIRSLSAPFRRRHSRRRPARCRPRKARSMRALRRRLRTEGLSPRRYPIPARCRCRPTQLVPVAPRRRSRHPRPWPPRRPWPRARIPTQAHSTLTAML